MYRTNTEFYTIVTDEQLATVIPEFVVDFMEYDKSKTYTLADACFPFPIELEDGKFMINIQLCSAPYLENRCVKGFITEQGYNLAMQFYGENNIFELEQ